MPFCVKCGTQLSSEVKYCSACGTAVVVDGSSAAQQAPEANQETKIQFGNLKINLAKREKFSPEQVEQQKQRARKASFVILITFLVLGLLTVVVSVISGSEQANKTPEQLRADSVSSAAITAHYKLESMIKESMNDPKSFEFVNYNYFDCKDLSLIHI